MKHKMLMVALLMVISGIVCGNTMQIISLGDQMFEEAKRGNWRNAYNCSAQIVDIIRNDNGNYTMQIIDCTYKVQHALLAWNIGKKTEAISMMKEVVTMYQSLDYDSAKNARLLLSAMQKDNIAGKFSARDVKSAYGGITDIVCGYPMNLASERDKRRHAVLMGMMDAEIGKLKQRQREIERRAKLDARIEYQNNTRRNFDENNPPRSGTYERQEWDYCKRIYDIFD